MSRRNKEYEAKEPQIVEKLKKEFCTSADIGKILNISAASAIRYLDELSIRLPIAQIGGNYRIFSAADYERFEAERRAKIVAKLMREYEGA